MKNVKVPLFGNPGKSATLDALATEGAIVGVNLRRQNGALVTDADFGGGSTGNAPDLGTTDDLDEGGYNLYFTDRRARDAVGAALVDTDSIDFTYTAYPASIKADLKDFATTTGGQLLAFTRDSKGRISQTKPVSSGDGINIADGVSSVVISVVGLPVFLVSQVDDQLTDQAGNLLISNQSTSLPVDWANITSKPTTLAGYGITDAQKLGAPVAFPPYTLTSVLAGTPAAATNQYKAIYVTGLTGGDEPCVSDGTNWRRFSDHTIAS